MIWTGSFRWTRLSRWFYFLIAMILAVFTVIVLLSITTNSVGRFVKDWRYITDAYIDAQASPAGEYGVVRKVVQASKPHNFTEQLELLTFGEGTHFAVHRQPGMNYSDILTQVVTSADAKIGKRQLPYPPEKLWCVSGFRQNSE